MPTKILSVADQDWSLIELGQRIQIKVRQAKKMAQKKEISCLESSMFTPERCKLL
jgi:hypothetical protein